MSDEARRPKYSASGTTAGERRVLKSRRRAYGYCPKCGAGNDTLGYAHLPTCQRQTTEHDLKVWPEFWPALESGEKTFEIRYNDREFRVGDTLLFREWSMVTGYSGRELRKRVTYLLAAPPWLADNYVCMGLQDV